MKGWHSTAAIFILWAAGLFPAAGEAQPASAWQKFVSADGSFSFHYPRSWKVKVQESIIEIVNPAAEEQLLIVALPYDRTKTPTDSAHFLIDALRTSSSPDIKASDWESNAAGQDRAVGFRASYSRGEKRFQSDVLVVKDDESKQTFWFSFSGPRSSYSRPSALALLQGLVSSLASGAGSAAPDTAPPSSDSIERNSRAFVFVLEFALSSPLTGSQEDTVLAELQRGWRALTDKERAKSDAYPKLVEAIIRASDLKALEDLRLELERTTREWLETSDRSDPAVSVIAAALKEKGRVLIPGNPPLTAMAASAYSEMYAYSELLAGIPNATPDRVSPGAAAKVKARLLEAWSGFSPEERSQVASAPGLWVSLRSILRYGTPEEQSRVRADLAAIAAPRPAAASPLTSSTSSSTRTSGRSDVVGPMIKHQVLMNIQQQTFNHYMYCRGFRTSIF